MCAAWIKTKSYISTPVAVNSFLFQSNSAALMGKKHIPFFSLQVLIKLPPFHLNLPERTTQEITFFLFPFRPSSQPGNTAARLSSAPNAGTAGRNVGQLNKQRRGWAPALLSATHTHNKNTHTHAAKHTHTHKWGLSHRK